MRFKRWLRASLLAALCPVLYITGVNLYALLPAVPPVETNDDLEGYFAYGSNMHGRYFTRIRGVRRAASHQAYLPDHAVAFNLSGIPSLEPSFANLAPKDGARAYGVLHLLPPGELEKVLGSEGETYNVKTVSVFLPDGSTAKAKTLIAPAQLSEEVLPSRRYLSYLHHAAVEHEMPAAVVERYDPSHGVYIPVVSEVFGASIQTAVWTFARL